MSGQYCLDAYAKVKEKTVSYSNSVVKQIANPCRGDPCGRPK